MKLTCAQMDILISFYIEGELSSCLKKQVGEHLQKCSVCAAKYDIVKSMVKGVKEGLSEPVLSPVADNFTNSHEYNRFKTNLSAYIDNELGSDENIKMKKFAINNKTAWKDLQDSYNLRRVMGDSYRKSKAEAKQDFCKSVMKQLVFDEDRATRFNPAISMLIAFTVSILVLSTIVFVSISM